ncbi:luc7-like protein 3 [Harpegnathos saltator]|uniref:luc7-like protein 3 n=1 Tax=Harpegnathos saltator TaxID=610380 RepID=UPI000DBEEEA4|nr:luc7-like protein 3 [Harpegnathos saltator]
MVKPSKPRLMARVLDAVVNLGDSRGSSAREVLAFIRQSNASLKNLTLQVRRALKHAVNAGLMRHRSGRYKVLVTLNPAPIPVISAKVLANNDEKSHDETSKSNVRAPVDDPKSSRRTQKRNKDYLQELQRRRRKRSREDEEFEDQSTGRYVLYGRDEKRSRVSKREFKSSDFSDGSDCESDVNRQRVSRVSTSSRWEAKRGKETRVRSSDKSTSRVRSAQRVQARQHPIEEVENDRHHRCDEDHRLTERGAEHQDESENVEGDRQQPSDGSSGNDLENS